MKPTSGVFEQVEENGIINIRIINPAGSTLIVALMQTLFDAILVAEAMIAFRVDLRIGEMAAQADGTYELLVNERFL